MRAREELLYADPVSYYTSDKVITYSVAIPESMAQLQNTKRGQYPSHHMALLDLQLRHLQAALLVGFALKRAVVLPRFFCTCQNEGIVPHENCKGPGHSTTLPYLCPTDHVFVPWELTKLHVKAPGFLNHPCMPSTFTYATAVLVSVLV